jgi:hypothetical protein
VARGVLPERHVRSHAEARAVYHDVAAGEDSRIQRGAVLWDQFERAVETCKTDPKAGECQLAERINELAVAKLLADDKGLCGQIIYEPDLLPSGRKIDFVADRGRDNLYVEVKTAIRTALTRKPPGRITLNGGSGIRTTPTS